MSVGGIWLVGAILFFLLAGGIAAHAETAVEDADSGIGVSVSISPLAPTPAPTTGTPTADESPSARPGAEDELAGTGLARQAAIAAGALALGAGATIVTTVRRRGRTRR